MSMKKRMITALLVFCMILPIFVVTAQAKHKDYSADDLFGVIDGIVKWKKSSEKASGYLLNDKFLSLAGTPSGDWYPIGLGRFGMEDDFVSYQAVIKNTVVQRYKTKEKLDVQKSTEWHRISLAVLATGGDPTNMGKAADGSTINLIADGVYNRGKTVPLGSQGVNGYIWGLIALDSMRYKVPADAATQRDTIITEILKWQSPDGGFSMDGTGSDPDITGMAIQALAPYYNSEQVYTYKTKSGKECSSTVRQIVDAAITKLSALQTNDGDFISWDAANAESTVQVMVALCALGIDPVNDARFIKNGNTVLDGIMKYRQKDGGFVHSLTYDENNPAADPNVSNSMASEQVLYALTALCRFNGNLRSLYDFRPEMGAELKAQIKTLDGKLAVLQQTATAAGVSELFNDYLKIPVAERSYVYHYYRLADAMKTLGIENTSEPLSEAMGQNMGGNGFVFDIKNSSEVSSRILINASDVASYEQIPKQVTTEHYNKIISLIDKIDKAENGKDYANMLLDLNQKKDSIENILSEIESINAEIMDKLYPFENILLSDKATIENLLLRVNKLNDYDKTKIVGYDDLVRAKTQVDGQVRTIWILIAVSTVAVILTVIVIFSFKKRRKLKKARQMPIEEPGEDEDW